MGLMLDLEESQPDTGAQQRPSSSRWLALVESQARASYWRLSGTGTGTGTCSISWLRLAGLSSGDVVSSDEAKQSPVWPCHHKGADA